MRKVVNMCLIYALLVLQVSPAFAKPVKRKYRGFSLRKVVEGSPQYSPDNMSLVSTGVQNKIKLNRKWLKDQKVPRPLRRVLRSQFTMLNHLLANKAKVQAKADMVRAIKQRNELRDAALKGQYTGLASQLQLPEINPDTIANIEDQLDGINATLDERIQAILDAITQLITIIQTVIEVVANPPAPATPVPATPVPATPVPATPVVTPPAATPVVTPPAATPVVTPPAATPTVVVPQPTAVPGVPPLCIQQLKLRQVSSVAFSKRKRRKKRRNSSGFTALIQTANNQQIALALAEDNQRDLDRVERLLGIAERIEGRIDRDLERLEVIEERIEEVFLQLDVEEDPRKAARLEQRLDRLFDRLDSIEERIFRNEERLDRIFLRIDEILDADDTPTVPAEPTPVATPVNPATPVATPDTPATPVATPDTPATPVSTPANPATPVATPDTPATPVATPVNPATPVATPPAPATPVVTPPNPATPVVTPPNPATPVPVDPNAPTCLCLFTYQVVFDEPAAANYTIDVRLEEPQDTVFDDFKLLGGASVDVAQGFVGNLDIQIAVTTPITSQIGRWNVVMTDDAGGVVEFTEEVELNTCVAAPVPATPVPATPVPATPVPATPVPATPVPATPVPATPVPATPVPATPVPATPVPGTPVPATPVPATPVPATPVPGTPAPTLPTPNPNAVAFAQVQPIIELRCMACHSVAQVGAPNPWTNDETFFVDTARVVPGDLENSLLYTYINGNPDGFPPAYMPKGAITPIPLEEINTIRQWILDLGPES